MKLYMAVLIAAVTVNCLVAVINGKTTTNTLAIPYTDTLLPPFEDVQDNSHNTAAKVTRATATATAITTTLSRTATNDVNNVLPELSIEALLPPLFDAKTEQNETKDGTKKKITSTTTTNFLKTTTTTTTRRPTTKKPSTTVKPYKITTTTTRTTSKPAKNEVPDLFLDSLLPPLFDKEVDTKTIKVTTQAPVFNAGLSKTTKKSYYQQKAQENNQKQQQLKHTPNAPTKDVKNYNKSTTNAVKGDQQVAATQTQTKQVALVSRNESQQKTQTTKPNYQDRQYNYNFNLFFGSTTPRPTKSGLPTITPFPYRIR